MSTTSPPAIRLGPESNGMLMTGAEYDAIDDCYDYELIHGVLIVSPIPLPTERILNDQLARLLGNDQLEHPRGGALGLTLPEHYIAIDDWNRRRADRVIRAGLGRKPDPGGDLPTIVVEFVSASARDRRRDYEEKRDEYLALDIAEYWIFDRFQRRFTVFEPGPDGRPVERAFGEAEVHRTARLPGFEFPAARFLELADRWGP